MGILLYDIIFLVIFTLFVIIFLYKRRKKIEREGIIFLYRTKLGIKFIDYVGKKYKKILDVLQYFSIIVGYFLMAGMIYLLVRLVYDYPTKIVKIIQAPPIFPVIPYFPRIFGVQSFFPDFYFIYFLLSILIVATVHEFSHGIFAKANGLKIKSTGFAFLGPFIGAFVEPDEKKMLKKPKLVQMSILSAGVFFNIITAIIFFLIMGLFFSLTFMQAGATFDMYAPTVIDVVSIKTAGRYEIENPSAERILNLIEEGKIEEDFIIDDGKINLTKITTGDDTYLITLRDLKDQLNLTQDVIFVYGNFPAIREGLEGTIVEFNGKEIKNNEDLSNELSTSNPGDRVTIKTKLNDIISSYDLELAENPEDNDKAFLGISSRGSGAGVSGWIYKMIYFYKKPSTAYEAKFNKDLLVFILDLLYWITLINFLVALFNMLPTMPFDGGRFFFLTILGLTKSEKIAKKATKFMGYLFLFILFLLMLFWLLSFI